MKFLHHYTTLSKIKAQRAMTLIELLIIMAIIGVLTTMANSWYHGYIESARINNAIAQIAALSLVIDDYIIENGKPPSSLSEIRNATLIDPWGRAYEYLKINLQNPGNYSFNRRDSSASSTASGGRSNIFANTSVTASYASRQQGYDDDDNDEQDNDDRDDDDRNEQDDDGPENNDYDDQNDNGSNSDDNDSNDDYYNDDDSSASLTKARKNNGVLLNTDYDLYSKGKDGDSEAALAVTVSQDDVLRANNGGFIGVVADF